MHLHLLFCRRKKIIPPNNPLKIGDYFLPPQFFDLTYEKQLDNLYKIDLLTENHKIGLLINVDNQNIG